MEDFLDYYKSKSPSIIKKDTDLTSSQKELIALTNPQAYTSFHPPRKAKM